MTTSEFLKIWLAQNKKDELAWGAARYDGSDTSASLAGKLGLTLAETRSQLGKLERRGLAWALVLRVEGRGRKNTKQTYKAKFWTRQWGAGYALTNNSRKEN